MPRGDGPDQTRRFPGADEPPTRRLAGAPDADRTRRLDGPGGPGDPGGQVLAGRYRLEGLLGAGGMADVHRATDLRLDRPVAVKVFRPGTDPDGERRFRDEARTLANLSHPGLIPVHDSGVEQHRAYLVMELVDGPTLREVIDRERMPVGEVARVGIAVAGVLAYVHDQGVVHRDVKPSNVLLDRSGRVRLADFGISRLMGASGLTSADVAVGTIAYMAPEQVQGGHVGPPADVYALGLVLLEACTGRREYGGTGWEGAAERLSRAPEVPRNLPGPMRSALLAMTETEPQRRPTARQAGDMLAAVTDVAPVAEPPRSGGGRTAVLAAGLVALIAVLALVAWAAGDEGQEGTGDTAVTATEEPAPQDEGPAGGSGDGSDGGSGSDEGSGDGSGGNDGGEGTGDGDGGFTPPSFDLPDVPDLPDASDLPDIPEVPDSVREDARSLWEQFTDWFRSAF